MLHTRTYVDVWKINEEENEEVKQIDSHSNYLFYIS